MRKSGLSLLLAAALLSGCSGNGMAVDNRINDPSVLEKDDLIRLGDAGVEDRTMQQMKAEGQYTSLQDDSGLIRTILNPSIQPMRGNYANNVITFGSLFMGTPYEYGSDRDRPNTFDCSDFTHWAFLGALGMDLPKDSRSQAKYVEAFGKRSYRNLRQAQSGDLLFFSSYRGPRVDNYRNVDPADATITHVGIYMGDGKMLHTASKATGGVRIDDIFGMHLEWRFVGGGSVLP